MNLRDSVVLVTGAGRGIGRALSLAFAREGARVALMGLTRSHLVAVQAEIEAGGGRTTVLPGDVSDEGSVSRCVAAAEQNLGPIDVLVNNAGVFAVAPVERLDALVFDHVLAVNLRGPFLMARSVLPGMKARRRGFAGGGAYFASKFGLDGLSQAMLYEARGHDVRVTCVFPSTVDTDLSRRAELPLPGGDRAVQACDVADAVVSLVKMEGRALPTSLEIWQTNPSG